ncbi:hypothetical protein HDV05_002177 [Chytridiales sp. JEL 0842]|nr:hypothetical protein HDV05_002177 [Chytridiales sp. JEL 0842]
MTGHLHTLLLRFTPTHTNSHIGVLSFYTPLLSKIILLFSILIIITILSWTAAVLTFQSIMPTYTSSLVLAYTLGLRHALDADHIAAIDNVTRRMVANKQKPITTGLMFSLGHSTVVFVACLIVAAVSAAVYKEKVEGYESVSGYIGGSISTSFLMLIAVVNGVSVYYIAQTLKKLRENRRAGQLGDDAELEDLVNQGGPMARWLGTKLFKIVNKPWKMYFVGFLFGLGFDTATEVTFLAIATLQGTQQIPSPWLILFLPLLFTCGMSLLDTLDGVLMLGIYGWSTITPARKLYYNLVFTLVSCLFAFLVALVQLLSLIQEGKGLEGGFWDFVTSVGDSSVYIGIFMCASFLVGWLISLVLYRVYYGSDEVVYANEGDIREVEAVTGAGGDAVAESSAPLAVLVNTSTSPEGELNK